jgi:hypothetical protein
LYRLSGSGPRLLAIPFASHFIAWLQTRDELAVRAGLFRPVIVVSRYVEDRWISEGSKIWRWVAVDVVAARSSEWRLAA